MTTTYSTFRVLWANIEFRAYLVPTAQQTNLMIKVAAIQISILHEMTFTVPLFLSELEKNVFVSLLLLDSLSRKFSFSSTFPPVLSANEPLSSSTVLYDALNPSIS